MILITGATGKLGGTVIDTLLKNNVPASQIAALVRDEFKADDLRSKGIDIRIGDYDNKPSLDSAMKGIDKVLLVSGLDISKVVAQHKNLADASKLLLRNISIPGIMCDSHGTLRRLKVLARYIQSLHYRNVPCLCAYAAQGDIAGKEVTVPA